jgi:hypothetical protein
VESTFEWTYEPGIAVSLSVKGIIAPRVFRKPSKKILLLRIASIWLIESRSHIVVGSIVASSNFLYDGLLVS